MPTGSDFNPKDVVKATQFCLEYQRKFRRDVFLDLVCYRRHGHNELDDPTFTNPLLYKAIRATKTMPDIYADKVRVVRYLVISHGNSWNFYRTDPSVRNWVGLT